MVDRDMTLSMVGVPQAQRRPVESQYPGGIVQFIQDCVEAVFARLPIQDNYFWRVYLTGAYAPDCCPEYLRPEYFLTLKAALEQQVTILKTDDGTHHKIVLLDHMDWLSDHHFPALEQEWEWIVRRAAPGARAMWRSGGLRTDYRERIEVHPHGQLRQLMSSQEQLAADLHPQDRVHTYGSFYIADLAA